MQDICIAAARRSAIGSLGGALATLSAAEIAAQVIAGILRETGLDPAELDEVLLGQVLQGGTGQNPARQAAMLAGIPNNVPAMTINKVCGAGQKSVHLAAQAIKAGDAELIIAGGQDSMSRAPHIIEKARFGQKAGDIPIRDMMVLDGLWDAFHNIHMGKTVEQLAQRFQITRAAQDAFALASQQKAAAAIASGTFDAEIEAVRVPSKNGETVFQQDEYPRETTLEHLSSLRPVFDPLGTITAGNSSGVNDGAAAILVGSARKLEQLNIQPMARIASYSSHAMEPMDMGLAPAGAARAALKKAGWSVDHLDVIEANEAFAAQSLAVQADIGWDPENVNPNGGAIALGHPLAGSGARVVVTLVHQMARTGAKRGLATLCIGGGMGVAICLERF